MINKVQYNLDVKETLNLFNNYKVLKFIEECYDVLHILSNELIVKDINEFIEIQK